MWVERTATVKSVQGLHARPARTLWDNARRFSSDVHILKDRLDVDAKSIFDIMTLDAVKGTELTVRAKGSDAEEAVRVIAELIETELDT